uniref:Uncharacterized protein n=1 Tax=Phlebotomus papatasi TaxID=29031 RepID=A0A1B0DMD4_PHLPP
MLFHTPTAPLTAHLQPQVQTVDVDRDAHLQCIVSGFPVQDIVWLHDGKPILRDNRIEIHSEPPRIIIKRVQKDDQGMYQCLVTNDWEQIQSTAELKLGGKQFSIQLYTTIIICIAFPF